MTRHLPTVDVVDLQTAWNEVLKRARLHAHHHISREELSVREHMSQILRKLTGRQLSSSATCSTRLCLQKACDRDRATSRFARTCAREPDRGHAGSPFAPIYMRLAYMPS